MTTLASRLSPAHGPRPDEDAALDTFTVRLPRWRSVRLFGRNPLIRAAIGSRHWLWCWPW